VRSVAGGRLEWWQASIRALVPGVAWSAPGAVGSFLAVGVYLSASFDERRRGLHDRAAGSLVVQTPRPPPFVPPSDFQGWYPGAVPPPPRPSGEPPETVSPPEPTAPVDQDHHRLPGT
jgi:hypothetical protein